MEHEHKINIGEHNCRTKTLFLLDPTAPQTDARVRWFNQLDKKYKEGTSKDLCNIVTGDKLWIYVYEMKTKHQSTL